MPGAANPEPIGTTPTAITPLSGRFDTHGYALPAQAALPLIGRERELQATSDFLRDGAIRLLTITGPGGIGKTRLAMRLAHELQDDFTDGVAFVSLGAIFDPALVLSAI